MSRIQPPETAFSKAGRVKVKPKVRKRSIQQVDDMFSLCVREGSDWTCARCGKQYQRGAQNLHCSHLWGRRLRAGRWNPLNAVAHDAACHMYLGEHPVEFAEWIMDHLGDKYDQWYEMKKILVKIRPQDRELLYQHFKTAHEEMLRMRDQGITGPIPFEGLSL